MSHYYVFHPEQNPISNGRAEYHLNTPRKRELYCCVLDHLPHAFPEVFRTRSIIAIHEIPQLIVYTGLKWEVQRVREFFYLKTLYLSAALLFAESENSGQLALNICA